LSQRWIVDGDTLAYSAAPRGVSHPGVVVISDILAPPLPINSSKFVCDVRDIGLGEQTIVSGSSGGLNVPGANDVFDPMKGKAGTSGNFSDGGHGGGRFRHESPLRLVPSRRSVFRTLNHAAGFQPLRRNKWRYGSSAGRYEQVFL
jgi:hypothetical protein